MNKFPLRAFNFLVYNREIYELLVANILFGFPKYYILEKSLNKVGLKNFQLYFPIIIFYDTKNKEATKSLIFFGISKIMPTFIFENYYYWGEELESYSF